MGKSVGAISLWGSAAAAAAAATAAAAPIPCVSSASNAVSVAKRPRGRPAGSKNKNKNKPKPKPEARKELPSSPLFLGEGEVGEFLKPIVLVVPGGADIINAIVKLGCEREVSISVHHASGPISEVHLCNSLSPSGDLSFKGKLHMSSLSGFYTKCLSPYPPKNIPFSFFNIQFLREKSLQLYGGVVGCKLIAAQPVHVMASMVKKHEYHHIPSSFF
ncbi:hypothetical protein VNO78_31855 [Psophocarpus tetragonolobus]|uniref:PPC domain-containing protein n=1 Tax=Psophocarpus tetragonolobus TaxID=3891 RepID=A0AAN9X9X6_PSOTE